MMDYWIHLFNSSAMRITVALYQRKAQFQNKQNKIDKELNSDDQTL